MKPLMIVVLTALAAPPAAVLAQPMLLTTGIMAGPHAAETAQDAARMERMIEEERKRQEQLERERQERQRLENERQENERQASERPAPAPASKKY